MNAFAGRFAAGIRFSAKFVYIALRFLNDYDIN